MPSKATRRARVPPSSEGGDAAGATGCLTECGGARGLGKERRFLKILSAHRVWSVDLEPRAQEPSATLQCLCRAQGVALLFWVFTALASDLPTGSANFSYRGAADACDLRAGSQDLCTSPALETDGHWIRLWRGAQSFWADPQPGQAVTWGPLPCADLSMSAAGESVRTLSVVVELEGDGPAYLASSMGAVGALEVGRNPQMEIGLSALCSSPIELSVVGTESEAWSLSPRAGRCRVALLPVGGSVAVVQCRDDGSVTVGGSSLLPDR